jgi:hypothetical protein
MFEQLFKSASRVTLLRFNGADQLNIDVRPAPTVYPNLSKLFPDEGYEGVTFRVDLQRGYAEEWLKEIGYHGMVDLITKEGNKILFL